MAGSRRGYMARMMTGASAETTTTIRYACDRCNKMFSRDFELDEHALPTGHRGILAVAIADD